MRKERGMANTCKIKESGGAYQFLNWEVSWKWPVSLRRVAAYKVGDKGVDTPYLSATRAK